MRLKFTLLVAIALFCHIAVAQLIYGDAVVTKSAANSTDQVVSIFDVSNSAAPLGNNWPWGSRHTPDFGDWDAAHLGQVFGLAINTDHPDKVIYAATTQIYGANIGVSTTAQNGYHTYPDPAPTGSPLIWELNPNGGGITAKVSSVSTPAFTSTGIFNRGTGIGNICYDSKHGHQIFATNMEDGMIYRINAATGAVLSRYEPLFPGLPNPAISGGSAPQFRKNDKIWGIACDGIKVYYSFWGQDYGHPAGPANSVYSVDLDATGDFVVAGGTGPDYVDALPNKLFAIQPMGGLSYSNPVADIEFSSDGKIMLLGERTMTTDVFGPDPITGNIEWMGWAHKSRVLRYNKAGSSSWAIAAQNYYVGNASFESIHNTNCAGGVDLGSIQNTPPGTCEGLVWATGDALKYGANGWDYGSPANQYVYGIAGIPINGNNPFSTSGGAPGEVEVSSIYQDIFSPTTFTYSGQWPDAPKTRPGDIDVYRAPCPPPCNIVANLTMPNINPCYGDKINFNTTNVGSWILPQLDGVSLVPPGFPGYPYFYVTTPSMSLDLATPVPVGTHSLCITVYSSDPADGAPVLCTDHTCVDFTVKSCEPCDPLKGSAHIAETHSGLDYIFTNTGTVPPDYIDWFIDDVLQGSTTTPSDFHYSFTAAGNHKVCMRAAYVTPGINGEDDKCCYSTDCLYLKLDYCDVWKTTDKIIVDMNPSNPQDVNFYFDGDRSHPLTVIWDFGDNTQAMVNDGSNISHHYDDLSPHHVCAKAIWSYHDVPVDMGDLDVCCCIDEECIDVDPCDSRKLEVRMAEEHGRFLVYELLSSTPIDPGTETITWTVDGIMQPGASPFFAFTRDIHDHTLCVTITYTIAGGTHQCKTERCIGVSALEISQGIARYYPNPTRNIVTVELQAHRGDQAVIQLTDYMGRPVRTQRFAALNEGVTPVYVNLLDYPAGIYLMKVNVGNSSEVVRVVKE